MCWGLCCVLNVCVCLPGPFVLRFFLIALEKEVGSRTNTTESRRKQPEEAHGGTKWRRGSEEAAWRERAAWCREAAWCEAAMWCAMA